MKYPEEEIKNVRNKLFELFETEGLNPAAILSLLGSSLSSVMATLDASENQVDLNLALIKRGWLEGVAYIKERKENDGVR